MNKAFTVIELIVVICIIGIIGAIAIPQLEKHRRASSSPSVIESSGEVNHYGFRSTNIEVIYESPTQLIISCYGGDLHEVFDVVRKNGYSIVSFSRYSGTYSIVINKGHIAIEKDSKG
jgi:prepilin-type N-terminal cleavage/methylation domain-containing protein